MSATPWAFPLLLPVAAVPYSVLEFLVFFLNDLREISSLIMSLNNNFPAPYFHH